MIKKQTELKVIFSVMYN